MVSAEHVCGQISNSSLASRPIIVVSVIFFTNLVAALSHVYSPARPVGPRGEMIIGGRQTPAVGSALPYFERRCVMNVEDRWLSSVVANQRIMCFLGFHDPRFIQRTLISC